MIELDATLNLNNNVMVKKNKKTNPVSLSHEEKSSKIS